MKDWYTARRGRIVQVVAALLVPGAIPILIVYHGRNWWVQHRAKRTLKS